MGLKVVGEKYWEAGGNCDMAIAAARLGLGSATIGHVGNGIYGRFLLDVLHDKGIGPSAAVLYSHHRADFRHKPAFSWMNKLSGEVKMFIKQLKILFCNCFGFDELSPGLIESALEYAIEVGTAIFFYPGPHGKILSSGTPEEQRALAYFLRMSDVLLLTSDEAESLTGIGNPEMAGQELLRKGRNTKWVIVKMCSRGLVTKSSISCAPAFKVNVTDTVGCGDSFVAAVAFGFIHNMPTVNTLTIANAVGATSAMVVVLVGTWRPWSV